MEGVEKALEEIRLTGLEYEILYLDAEDEVLVKRYKETRRTHPLAEVAGWKTVSARSADG